MKLLNRYHSRVFQFATELMAHLSAEAIVTQKTAEQIAARTGLDYADQVLKPLCDTGILEKTDQGYTTGSGFSPFALSPHKEELDYLKYILAFPEAKLFLPDKTLRKLETVSGSPSKFGHLQYYAPKGTGFSGQPRAEDMRRLLKAIRERRMVRYHYRTKDRLDLQESTTLPWKLEYSVFDRRWWIILYEPDQRRTIKARLDNLQSVELLGGTNISEEEISNAIEQLLEPEPVVLEVEPARNALERCFLVFEGQLFLETQQVSENRYRLSFQYHRFDRGEILRRLLYLGSMVTVIEPASMREELLAMVEQALSL